MRSALWGVVFLISLVFQSTLFSFFQIRGVRPDLLIILVIFVALFRGPIEGGKAGFLAGLLEDLVVGQFIGMNAFIKMFVGVIVGLFEKRVYRENLLIPTAMVFIGTFIEGILFILLFNSFGPDIRWTEGLYSLVMPMCLYNTIIGFLTYKPIYRFHRYLKGKRWSFKQIF
jgi:rod shape-determining protein MreD